MAGQGKLALVTEVRHFVGMACAEVLAADGFRVLCHDESFADADARVAFEAEKPGLLAAAAVAPADLVGEAERRFGPPDVLVANHAAPAIRAPVEDVSVSDLQAGFSALVAAPFALIGTAVPAMKQRGSGAIVLVTSAAPLQGLTNYSAYVALRGAQNAMTASWARELAPFGIRVNAVAPNYVESPTYFPPSLLANPEAVAKMTRNVPLRRLGKPYEVGRTVAFLASDDAGFVTGHVLPVAGGWP